MHRKIYSFVLFTYSDAQSLHETVLLGFQQWRFILFKYTLASFISEICMFNIKTHCLDQYPYFIIYCSAMHSMSAWHI